MAEDETDAVRRLEERRWTALTSSDTATLRELFDDGVVAYTQVQRSDEVVRTFGDTAVVTGRAVIDAVAAGRALQTIARYTAVWARRSGGWRFVGWHATPATD